MWRARLCWVLRVMYIFTLACYVYVCSERVSRLCCMFRMYILLSFMCLYVLHAMSICIVSMCWGYVIYYYFWNLWYRFGNYDRSDRNKKKSRIVHLPSMLHVLLAASLMILLSCVCLSFHIIIAKKAKSHFIKALLGTFAYYYTIYTSAIDYAANMQHISPLICSVF